MKFTKQTKQVVILYASTLSGVLLGVVASIINTRFLSPADYGDVRYVQNIINFIASLLLFGYFLSGSRLLALSNNELRSRTIRGTMLLILIMACVVLSLSNVVLKFRMTEALFKKRRNGWVFAKKQLADRLQINKNLHYGHTADLFAYAMFCLLIAPAWVKKIAYKIFR